MKKIGFVDYYLSEWHANNYPAWIEGACRAAGLSYTLAYAWAEERVSPLDGITTEQWCEKFGATPCATIDELCEKSDVIIILAPSHPEKHLLYAQKVLRYGKRTYIDKTFAPSLAEAEEMFRLSEQYGAPFFSTSALRYGEGLDALVPVSSLKLTGGGSNMPEYIIHQIEMAVKLLGDRAVSVQVRPESEGCVCLLETAGGARAELHYAPTHAFTVDAETKDGENASFAVPGGYFDALIADMLRFFETGVPSFPGEQTVEAIRIRDAILRAAAAGDGAVYPIL